MCIMDAWPGKYPTKKTWSNEFHHWLYVRKNPFLNKSHRHWPEGILPHPVHRSVDAGDNDISLDLRVVGCGSYCGAHDE